MEINKRTAQDIWKDNPDKTTYYWTTSGIHSYNAMLKYEKSELDRLAKQSEEEAESKEKQKAKEEWSKK